MRWKKLLLLFIDAALVNGAVLGALLLRFEEEIPFALIRRYAALAPFHTALVLAALDVWKVNRSLWRYAGVPTAVSLFQALALVHAGEFFVNALIRPQPFPRSIVILAWVLSILSIGGTRLLWRLYRGGGLRPSRRLGRRVLIAGAGDIGALVAREIQRGHEGVGYAVGFVDDDPIKFGRRIENLGVLGTTFDIPRLIRELAVDEIIVAAPSAPSRLIRQIHTHAMKAGIRVGTVPALADFIEGKGALRQVRDVSIEDLLGRDPVKIDQAGIEAFLSRKRILVTGAGGSIGSELCRQIARFRPARLIALDHDENQLTYLAVELSQKDPTLDLLLVVGDIKDASGICELAQAQKPEVIFHAAAHKHVHLLEERPREAVRNNIQGTLNIARAAQSCGADAMVFISTDKAVDPTNVMGASKRACELVIQALQQRAPTIFTAVRFGNVMGSEGSVIPIFQRQLARGGPLTVTHPDARRYFMTVSEAAQLVLQAASLGKGGDIFILDMGEQVKILDVARQLLQLSGAERTVSIVFTGLRPGEKLEEDILTDQEKVRTTRHAKVFRCHLDPVSGDAVLAKVARLVEMAESEPPNRLKALLKDLVTEYRPGFAPPPLPSRRGDEPAETAQAVPTVRLALRKPTPLKDRVVALAILTMTALPMAVLLGSRRLMGPRDVVLAREVRIGRDRRDAERRKPTGWTPIDRRFRDRRRRDLGGKIYTAYRVRFEPAPASSRLSRIDRLLRMLGAEALPGFLNVFLGHATLNDLYPGSPVPNEPEPGDWPDVPLPPRDGYSKPSVSESRRGEL